MNIFDKLATEQHVQYLTLGYPLYDLGAGRRAAFAFLTKGKGFRSLKKEPENDSNNLTRGQRKRKTYARLFLGVTDNG